MIRQILIAKTVCGSNVILQTADGVEGINEIRAVLIDACTKRCYQITDAEGEVKECLYLEHWGRDSGVIRVMRLKTEEQLKEMELAAIKLKADQAAKIAELPEIGNTGTTEATQEPEAEEPEATQEPAEKQSRRRDKKNS